MSDAIKTHMQTSAQVKLAVAESCSEAAMQAAEAIAQCLKQGGKLLLCGNGGSAGDAQHLAAEFVATLDHQRPRAGLAALALTTDTSFITAYSNDFGFEGIFERQLQALGQSGDVVIGISTSGNSANVNKAMAYARANQITTIAMTGAGGGNLASHADIMIAVPSTNTMHIQESHIALGHAITHMVEQLMDAG
jgi:D-sedoheptulose 7-phosphate isomerase